MGKQKSEHSHDTNNYSIALHTVLLTLCSCLLGHLGAQCQPLPLSPTENKTNKISWNTSQKASENTEYHQLEIILTTVGRHISSYA